MEKHEKLNLFQIKVIIFFLEQKYTKNFFPLIKKNKKIFDFYSTYLNNDD